MNNKLYKTLRVAIPLLLMTLLTFYCSSGGDSKTSDYICTNGIKADGTTSTANTEKCMTCNTSYKLETAGANKNKCVLPDGVFLWVTKTKYTGNLMGDGGVTGTPTGADGQAGADAKCAHADNVPAYLSTLTNHRAILFKLNASGVPNYTYDLQRVASVGGKPSYQSVARGTDAAITLSLGEKLLLEFQQFSHVTSPEINPRVEAGLQASLRNRSNPYVKNMGTSLTLTYWSGANRNLGDVGDEDSHKNSSNCNEWTSTNDTHTGNIGNAGWEQTVGGVDLTANYWLDLIDVWRETGGSGDQVHSNIKSNCVTGQQRLLCASYNTP